MDNQIVAMQASVGDETAIAEIASTVKIPDENAKAISGFLVWVQRAEVYKHRIELSKNFFVAKTTLGEIVGFLMAYDFEALCQLQHEMSYEDNLLNFALSRKKKTVVFVDQLAVHPSWHRKGIASQMYQSLLQESQPDILVAGILHHPIKNSTSINFFHGSLGWNLAAEIVQDSYTWGMYEYVA